MNGPYTVGAIQTPLLMPGSFVYVVDNKHPSVSGLSLWSSQKCNNHDITQVLKGGKWIK